MRPEDRDPAYLWDMREAAMDGLQMAEGMTYERFERGKLEQYALAKAVEVVGEAASRVSRTLRDAHPEIPWSDIVGMRNRLVHDYQNIDLEVLWSVVTTELRPLVERLSSLIPEPPGDPG